MTPKDINFDAYQKILKDASIIRSMYVSIVMTFFFTMIGMILTISAAYALSRRELKGRGLFTFLIMKNNFQAGIPESLIESAFIDELVISEFFPVSLSLY